MSLRCCSSKHSIVEIYPAVRRLGRFLDFDFVYSVSQKKVHEIRAYPEVQIVSLIVLATKLCHPFDDIDRTPESDLDPTTLKMDWAKWRRVVSRTPLEGLRSGDEVKITDEDVLGMNERKMDDYLDWYQRTWIDDRDPKSIPFHLLYS